MERMANLNLKGGTIEKARWYLLWVHERCQKPESATFCAALQREVHAKGGRICFMKKAQKFAQWLHPSVPDACPYVLLTDWREVKPCFEAVSADPTLQSPVATIVLVPDGRSALRANAWCKEQREMPSHRMLVVKGSERAEDIADKAFSFLQHTTGNKQEGANGLGDLQSQQLAQMFAERAKAASAATRHSEVCDNVRLEADMRSSTASGDLVKFNSNRSVMSFASETEMCSSKTRPLGHAGSGDLVKFNSNRSVMSFASEAEMRSATASGDLMMRSATASGDLMMRTATASGDLVKFNSNRSTMSWAEADMRSSTASGDLVKFKSNRSTMSFASVSTAASLPEYIDSMDLDKYQEPSRILTPLPKDGFSRGYYEGASGSPARSYPFLVLPPSTVSGFTNLSNLELAKMLTEAQPDCYED
jgi:hypothetical protein